MIPFYQRQKAHDLYYLINMNRNIQVQVKFERRSYNHAILVFYDQCG